VGLVAVLAGVASGPLPLVPARALVISPAKPVQAPISKAPRAAGPPKPSSGDPKPSVKTQAKKAHPQTVLKRAINDKLDRITGKKDVIYKMTEDDKKGFRAVAELACLPGSPSREGQWMADEKEARHSAAKAILDDPFLGAVLNKPVQDLRNLVMKHVKRQPKADDVVYTVREEPSAAPEARFVATVQLGALDGNPSAQGEPRKSEMLAKWSAAEAMLLSPDFQAQIKPKAPKDPTAPEILQMLVDKKLRRVVTKEDIVYTVEERKDMPPEARFRATVSLPFLRGRPTVAGKARPGWKRAKQAAAEAFLADPVARASLSANPVADLRSLIDKKLRRKTYKDDIVYTIMKEDPTEAGGSASFRAKAELRCLTGSPAREGEPCKSESLAKRLAAEALLEDPDVQRLLRSRDAADVLNVAVAGVAAVGAASAQLS